MSRIILMTEAILGVLSISIYVSGGSVLSVAALSPFLLIPVFPLLAASAVWPVRLVALALSGSDELRIAESDGILRFCELFAVTGGILGGVVGIATVLLNHELINEKICISIGKSAGTGIIALFSFMIVVRQIRERAAKKREDRTIDSDYTGAICGRYGITRREREIFLLIAEGFSNREISVKLAISEDTVRNHLHNIFIKTGVKNRNGLAGLLAVGKI